MYLIENDTQLWTSGVSTVPYSRYALRQFILKSSNDIYQDKQLRLVIETTEGVAVGFVDLQDYDALPVHRFMAGCVSGMVSHSQQAVKEFPFS
ncbi:MAG: hypothetical protein II385_04840, partial [Bacteroidaceae bacterium]|nr:hypothetical protein [Bacteroidaceae bacterium]